MKKLVIVIGILIILFYISIWAEELSFADYFENATLRIDYYHIADGQTDIITIDRMYKQEVWAGNPNHLLDKFNNGLYYIKIYDLKTGFLIYSKGFNSYCGEYKTIPLAKRGIKKTFHETAMIPFPKEKIRFVLETLDRKYKLSEIFTKTIDPTSININTESITRGVVVFPLLENGNSHKKVDLVIVAEGYTLNEKNKVIRDLKRVKEIFLNAKPYSYQKDLFNIYGVFYPSGNSGSDQPTKKIFKNTILDSAFNSLGLFRYLLFENNRNLRDITAGVPCDAIIVMANNERYGGGGIYNSFCIFSIDNDRADYLLLHEFGHSFAGLADEYYSSSVAYDEFYPRGLEPLEPNITALLNRDKVKWEKYLTKGVNVPTPWQKEQYENSGPEYYNKRSALQKELSKAKKNKDKKKIEKKERELEELTEKNKKEMDYIFRSEKIKDLVGVFEGAGYSAKGLYRPMVDCIMFSTSKIEFCKVCEAAVLRMIEYYTEYDPIIIIRGNTKCLCKDLIKKVIILSDYGSVLL